MKNILLFLLLIFASPIIAAKTVLVIGDSLSAAYNLNMEDGWVALLEQRLVEEFGEQHEVFNASISGDTTAGGLARLPAALERHNPDIVILELGANDGLRGFSLVQMKSNLEQMIRMIQARDAQVILAGMQIPPNLGPVYTQRFSATYAELAEQYQVTLIPFFLEGVGGVTELVQNDGLHPNRDAQPILVENVLPYLTKLLERG